MSKLRFLLALWMAKLSIPALKITRHNGTDFPGMLALRLCPDFLRHIGRPDTVVVVTGTNGKTTVSNLLNDILTKQGKKILSNREGSNIASGIATALLKGCGLFGKAKKYDLALLEVDERSTPRIYPYVKPNCVVLTNLFRDSIMRNAHPAYIAGILDRYIPEDAMMIVNADDLISSGVAAGNRRVRFGIGAMDQEMSDCENLINDMRICPQCAGKLSYEYRHYHHIGKAVCAQCGFRSPDADYLVQNVDLAAGHMEILEGGKAYPYPLINDSLFNIYNMVTVAATLRQFGMEHEDIAAAMADSAIVGTRLSREQVGSVGIVMQMSKDKNALACSRNLDYIRRREGKKELLLMMNCLGVAKEWSENPSWLYDADFEFINQDGTMQVVCAGARAHDYKLRLLLAGVPEEKISVEEDEFKALELLKLTPGEDVYILYGVDGMPLAFRVKARLKEMLEAREEK